MNICTSSHEISTAAAGVIVVNWFIQLWLSPNLQTWLAVQELFSKLEDGSNLGLTNLILEFKNFLKNCVVLPTENHFLC